MQISSKPARKAKEIVYVGVGSELMAKSFCRILKLIKPVVKTTPEILKKIKICLYGTDGRWKPGQHKILQDLAESLGLGKIVEEDPTILPYSKSLELMRNADGLLVLGVEDLAYMPSKLFSYSRSGKPLLASLVSGSQALDYFKNTPEIGHVVTFGDLSKNDKSYLVFQAFLEEVLQGKEFKREQISLKYSDFAMTQRHAGIFKKVIAASRK